MSEQDDINLDRAVEQANSPVIRRPTVLDAEALKASEPISLADRLAANQGSQPHRIPGLNKDGSVRKPRGRPPGSSNKPKEPGATRPTEELTLEQRHAHKLHRANELSTKVGEAINDNMMLMLMAMGAPSELLYKPGMAPQRVVADSKYTDFAQSLVMGPMQLNIVGRFLAELEATDMGTKFAGTVTDGKGPLFIYGGLSLAALIQWGKGLSDAYKKFEPLLKEYKEYQQQQQQPTGG